LNSGGSHEGLFKKCEFFFSRSLFWCCSFCHNRIISFGGRIVKFALFIYSALILEYYCGALSNSMGTFLIARIGE
jgi:hypothetical protein